MKSHESLFNDIISLENLFLAWEEFKKGKTKKVDVLDFEFKLEDNLFELHQELKNKTYKHSHYTSFNVCDPKLRRIHKACVRDRVLQHAVFRKLYPLFDGSFIFDSYSCRIGKGTHRASKRLENFSRKLSKNNKRNFLALKCDVRKFFDSVDKNILKKLIGKRIKDKDTSWLIYEIIDSFEKEKGKGLPLGNVTSQLFANIYLNEFDQFIKHKLKANYYLRYCDDFLILSDDKEYLFSCLEKISVFLKENLKLLLHPDKVSIIKYSQGIDFVGYVVLPHYKTLRTKTKKRIVKKVSKNKEDLKNNIISKEYFDVSLNSYLGVLKHCDGYKIERILKL